MPGIDDSPDTSRLLRRTLEGDQAARDRLFAEHRSYLRRVVDLRMDDQLRRRLDPSDVVQEAQLVGSRRLEDYLRERPMSFRLWLRWIAIEQLANLHRHHVRTRKRSVCREVPLTNDTSVAVMSILLQDQPSRHLRRQETAARVQEALTQLSESDRQLLLLRHAEELTNEEVAELLGIERAAAVKRHGRALRRLHDRLQRLGISSSE